MTVKDAAYALNLLERAVAERGENLVADCRYVIDNEPGCLVGLALHLDGVSIGELLLHEGQSAKMFASDLGYTDEAVQTFCIAQQAQDEQETWGTALSDAR